MQEAGVKVTDFDGSVINLDSKMVVVANETFILSIELVQDARICIMATGEIYYKRISLGNSLI